MLAAPEGGAVAGADGLVAPLEGDVDGAVVGAAEGDPDVTGAGATGCTGEGAVAAPLFTPWPSDFFSNKPGIENKNAIKKNTTAAVTVTFARTVLVPLGPNAVELAPPPPKIAAASALPG